MWLLVWKDFNPSDVMIEATGVFKALQHKSLSSPDTFLSAGDMFVKRGELISPTWYKEFTNMLFWSQSVLLLQIQRPKLHVYDPGKIMLIRTTLCKYFIVILFSWLEKLRLRQLFESSTNDDHSWPSRPTRLIHHVSHCPLHDKVGNRPAFLQLQINFFCSSTPEHSSPKTFTLREHEFLIIIKKTRNMRRTNFFILYTLRENFTKELSLQTKKNWIIFNLFLVIFLMSRKTELMKTNDALYFSLFDGRFVGLCTIQYRYTYGYMHLKWKTWPVTTLGLPNHEGEPGAVYFVRQSINLISPYGRNFDANQH